MSSTLPPGATVHVVDDDEAIRELLRWLMKREGIAVEVYPNASSFLHRWADRGPACLVLDLFMPDMTGLDVQKRLKELGVSIPVIFLSGRADVPKAVHAVKSGAADFIEKPFDYRNIVGVVRACLERDARERGQRERDKAIADRMATLTQREKEVLEHVVRGRTNRYIAEDMAISVKTVEAHRAKIMEKLQVGSIAELVHATLSGRAP